jgi:hypothetical protein
VVQFVAPLVHADVEHAIPGLLDHLHVRRAAQPLQITRRGVEQEVDLA